MQGYYNIGGEVAKNVITIPGKIEILNAVAGKAIGFTSAIMVGIGSTAATSSDTSLEFIIGGQPLSTIIVDPVNFKIYFKTILPAPDQYTVYEAGCYGSEISSSDLGSLLCIFNAATIWNDTVGTSTLDTTISRLGLGARKYTLAAGATGTGNTSISATFSGLANTTLFKLAYNSNNITSASLRFKVDSSNYYSTSLTVTNGYHISSVQKGSFTITGTPTWDTVTQLEVTATANGSGGYIGYDACRYDSPLGNQNSGILSRVVLGTPKQKFFGVTMDSEYELDLTF